MMIIYLKQRLHILLSCQILYDFSLNLETRKGLQMY